MAYNNSTTILIEKDSNILNRSLESTQQTVHYSGLKSFSESYSQIHGYVVVFVCVWGTAANIANVVVLTRKKMISPTNLILTWLAVADLLTMISCLPVSIHFNIKKDPILPFPSTRYKSWIVYFLFNINFTVACHTAAIWLTIALAIFRYICICWPSRGAELCSLHRSKVAIFLIYISTAVICIPNYLVAIIVEKEPENTTTGIPFTYYMVADTDVQWLRSFNYWIQALFFKLIPCVLLTILTILLVIAMHEANVRRMKLKSQGRQDECDRARETNRTTAMLLAVVGLFLLTELPQGILTLCSLFISHFYENVYEMLGDLLDIAALLNNSINFVLYCVMSRQFRETFIETFCACLGHEKLGWLKLEKVNRQPSTRPIRQPSTRQTTPLVPQV